MTVANTGSVSQSYDGDRRASYLVIEGERVTIRRVEYDVESEANELLRSGLPHADWMSRILLADDTCLPTNETVRELFDSSERRLKPALLTLPKGSRFGYAGET